MKKSSLFVFLLILFINITGHTQEEFISNRGFSIIDEPADEILSDIQTSTTTEIPEVSTTTTPSEPEVEKPLAPPQITYKAGAEFLRFLEEKDVLYFTRERWEDLRRSIEEGVPLEEEGVVVSTVSRPAPPPLPPGLAVELPYESQLSISGRKTIGVSFKSIIYEKEEDQKRQNQTTFDMAQELQVRIKGRVGRKINVNVDFDDTTADKRDISIVYKGDPDEIVQEAAFGDITMTLPSTEFVGYSRQLFGIKVHTKYRGLKSWGFFSRTKGLSEIKRFEGTTKLESKTIYDYAYIDRKYYLIQFGNDVIKSGTVRVYVDDRNPNNNNINTSTATTVQTKIDSLTTLGAVHTGDFDLLTVGKDYTVDYNYGFIQFRYPITKNYVVAVDYEKEDGTLLSSDNGRWKIIKDENNRAGITRVLKTFYNLGHVKIMRDLGHGNFILRVQDLDNVIPVEIEGGKPTPEYSNTNTYSKDTTPRIRVDFDSGIFYITAPDGNLNVQPFHNVLYSGSYEQAVRNHKYNIFAEYRYRIKEYPLRPGIVPQSERVVLDGQTLQRDIDYFIDYDIGQVIFYDEEKITENSVIEISYDYAPFGAAAGSTLVGTRSELSLTDNIFVGGSFIYDFAAQSLTTPDIRTTPSSLMVWETDSRLQDIEIPYTPLSLTLGGEYAQSKQNPNIMNKAIIESMEGVKEEENITLFHESWQPGRNPTGEQYYKQDITWTSAEVSRTDINPALDLETDEKQQVLSINYNLSRSEQLSMVQKISNVGIDYSDKLFLEMWINGDANNEKLIVAYGSFNEDADGDGELDTEDKNPKDGTLNSGEDIGWDFNDPDNEVRNKINVESKIDTEDLDNDGELDSDASNNPTPYEIDINWKGWQYVKIPLEIQSYSYQDWSGIKQIRLTIEKTGTSDTSNTDHTLQIGAISLVSNRWEPAGTYVDVSSLTISGINNEDDEEYAKKDIRKNNHYMDLYEIDDTDSITGREQALSLRYSIATTSTTEIAAKLLYKGRNYDFSNYRQFKF
ncbi:MAG: hypothetical protein JW871_02010, partial [Endomicrobiales bacterium]|nr:hypothetical protein [Endomicrobiales bacterium]